MAILVDATKCNAVERATADFRVRVAFNNVIRRPEVKIECLNSLKKEIRTLRPEIGATYDFLGHEDWEIDSIDMPPSVFQETNLWLLSLEKEDCPSIGRRLELWNNRVEVGQGDEFQCFTSFNEDGSVGNAYNVWRYTRNSFTETGWVGESVTRDCFLKDLPIRDEAGNDISPFLVELGWQIYPLAKDYLRTYAVPPSGWHCESPLDPSCGWTNWIDPSGKTVFSYFWKAMYGRLLECFARIH